jgi:hypothetical protein
VHALASEMVNQLAARDCASPYLSLVRELGRSGGTVQFIPELF